jgi:hypothetical protein
MLRTQVVIHQFQLPDQILDARIAKSPASKKECLDAGISLSCPPDLLPRWMRSMTIAEMRSVLDRLVDGTYPIVPAVCDGKDSSE